MIRDRLFGLIRQRLFLGTALVLYALSASGVAAQTLRTAMPHPKEAPFLAANDNAMIKMMKGMAIKPTGDVDTDFAAMMIPHHQGAIDMAEAELRWGRNEQLRRIAQEIIVDQGQEITAMRLAVGQPLPPSAPAPTGGAASTPVAPTRDISHPLMTTPMEHAR